MSIVPVEVERVCERRWGAKFRQPIPAEPLYQVERIDRKDMGEPSAPELKAAS